MEVWLPLVALVASFAVARATCGPVMGLLSASGAVRPNYRGQEIPVGVGFLFFFSFLPVALVTALALPNFLTRGKLFAFLFLTALTTLTGIIDDLLGSRDVSGLKGHLSQLLRGKLTTGAVKALATGGGSLLVFAGAPLTEALLNALVVALLANAMNLFDLRPGRAGKVFLAAAFPLSFVAWGKEELFLLWGIAGALLAFLPADLEARAMMGDAGANTLGAGLGLVVVWSCSPKVRAVVLVGLLVLHLLTERYSLTEIIRRNRLLNFLDRLGRGE